MLVLNFEDLDRELKKVAADAIHPAVQAWIRQVAKDQVMGLQGRERDEEFKPYYRQWQRLPLDGVPDVLPAWVEEALQNNRPVQVFDPIQPNRRTIWRQIGTILDWFNGAVMADANYAQLSFQKADQTAKRWRDEVNKRYDPNKVPAKKPEGTMANAKCPNCVHEFQYPYNRHRASIAISCPQCFELIILNPEAS